MSYTAAYDEAFGPPAPRYRDGGRRAHRLDTDEPRRFETAGGYDGPAITDLPCRVCRRPIVWCFGRYGDWKHVETNREIEGGHLADPEHPDDRRRRDSDRSAAYKRRLRAAQLTPHPTTEMEDDMTDANDLLMGGGAAYASFLTVGTMHRGTITEIDVQQQTDIDGNLKTWPKGDPMMMVVLTIATDERDPEKPDDDGARRLFVKGAMHTAVRDAIKASGASGIDIGGQIAVKYDRDGTPKQNGYTPPKLYTAQYAPPSPAAAANDMLGAAPADEPAPAAAPAPAPAAAQPAASML